MCASSILAQEMLLWGTEDYPAILTRKNEIHSTFLMSITYFSSKKKEKMLVYGILILKHGVYWWSDRAEGRDAV